MLSIHYLVDHKKINITEVIYKFHNKNNILFLKKNFLDKDDIKKKLVFIHLAGKNYRVDNSFDIYIDLNISKIFTSKKSVPKYILDAHELQEISFDYEKVISNKLNKSNLKQIFNNQFVNECNIKTYRHQPNFSIESNSANLEVNVKSLVGSPHISIFLWDDIKINDPFKFITSNLKKDKNLIEIDSKFKRYITYSFNLKEGDELTIDEFSINKNNFINKKSI